MKKKAFTLLELIIVIWLLIPLLYMLYQLIWFFIERRYEFIV